MRSMRSVVGAVLFCLVFSAFSFAAEGKKLLPRPTGETLEKAEAEIQSIFARDLAAADRPSKKAAIAKQMIDVALETPDHDPERFVLCDKARGLAVEGRDKALAFKAAAAIAERYEPDGPTDSKEQFDKAQGLWSDAEKAKGDERLKLQAEAAEWYAYALPGLTSINKLLAEKRLAVEPAVVAKPVARPVAISKANDLKTLLGTWSVKLAAPEGKIMECRHEFLADGRAILNPDSASPLPGKWMMEPECVRVQWSDKWWATYKRPLDPAGAKGDGDMGPGVLHAVKIVDGGPTRPTRPAKRFLRPALDPAR